MISLFTIALISSPFQIDSWYLHCYLRFGLGAFHACQLQQVNLHIIGSPIDPIVYNPSVEVMGSFSSFEYLGERSAPEACHSKGFWVALCLNCHFFDSFGLLPRKFYLLLVRCNHNQEHSSIAAVAHWKVCLSFIYIWNPFLQALQPFLNYVYIPLLICLFWRLESYLACPIHHSASWQLE